MNEKILVKYVRDEHRRKIGVVVALSPKHVGWSKCNFKKGDRFDKDLGMKIAIGRATLTNRHNLDVMPFCVIPDYCAMVNRAINYFKNNKN